MDPLSITVAITGLIATAAQLRTIVEDAKNATKEQDRILKELTGWSVLLRRWESRLKGARPEDEWYHGILELAKPEGTISAAGHFIPNGKFQPDGIFVLLKKAYDELLQELRPEHGLRKLSKILKWSWDKVAVDRKLAEIGRLTNTISQILDDDQFTLSRKQFEAIGKKLDAAEKRQEKEERIKQERRQQKERDAIIKWLSPLEMRVTQNENFARAAPQIGQWLLKDSEEFREWVRGPHKWALDCYAPQGFGKTVMSSIVVHHLQEQFEGKNIPVLYLYLNHKEKRTQTLENLFSSLLKQLVEHQSATPVSADIRKLYLKARGEFRPQPEEIDKLFKLSLRDFKRVFIVVDALDECSEDIRVELSDRLHELLSKKVSIMVTQRAESNRPKEIGSACNICGRRPIQIYYTCWICETGFDICQSCKDKGEHCSDTSHGLSEVTEVLEIDIRIPDAEIEKYVSWEINNELKPGSVVSRDPRKYTSAEPRTRLGQICHEHPQLKKEIPEQIVANTNGMILMAWLYVDSLKVKQNRQQVENALRSLPQGLDSMYAEIMKRIDDLGREDSSLARRVLSWIVYTHRPLSLVELQHALAVSYTDVEFNPASIFHKQLLLSITAGLVNVDTDGLAVRLTHYTAHEYFDKNREKYFPETAAEVARVTLTYLSFRSLSEPCQSIREDQEVEARLRSRPFLSYAAQYWGVHVLEAASDSTIQDAVLQFLSEPGRVASIIQAAWYMDTTGSSSWDVRKDVNSLHVCAWFGLDATVRELVKRGLVVDSRDTYRQTALIYACRRGHTTTVKTLLDLGADVTVWSLRDSTPMFEAIHEGHVEVVKVLLAVENLPVNDVNPKKLSRTALMLAAGAGMYLIVDELLKRKDIDVNMKDEGGSTALSIAAEAGHDFVVDSLLRNRDADDPRVVDINSVNRVGSSALTLAAKAGYSGIVWSLLECKADPEIIDGEGGGTAILRAVDNGQVDVVMTLLDYKVNVTRLDNLGRSLLHSASLNGSDKIVRLLVGEGLDPNILDKCERTPLHDSARTGKINVTKALLELGANRALQDCHGRIPHEVARQHGHRRIMLILEGKEDISNAEVANLGPIPDPETLPIWSLAKIGMKDLIVKAIAQQSSDITERDPDGNDTALHWAVASSHAEILQLLLDSTDLSPSAVNDYGRTPLHLASIDRNLPATTILLSLPRTRTAPLFLDLPDKFGDTPLTIASAYNFYPLATALIAAGAVIETRKVAIQPLFFAAVELGNVDAVEKLILAGADVLAKRPDGLTGLQIAKEARHDEVIKLLQRKQSFFVPLRTYSERSRESGRSGDGEGSETSTLAGTSGATTPAVSPRPEMGRKASFAFRPRPGQVGSEGSTPSSTPGVTPVVSPRPEMGRRGSLAFRPRPGQVGGT